VRGEVKRLSQDNPFGTPPRGYPDFFFTDSPKRIGDCKMNDYDKMVQWLQDGEITVLQFIMAQPDLLIDYRDYCLNKHVKPSKESAAAFLEWHDEKIQLAIND